MNMELNELRDEAFRIAKNHGWHDEEKSNEHWTMLIISEIAEAVEADRKNRHAKSDYYETRVANSIICKGLDPEIPKEKGYQAAFEEAIKDSVEDELADVVIRILDLCGLKKVDFSLCNQAFVVADNKREMAIVAEIKKMSFSEFAFSCVKIAIAIEDIDQGYIYILLHRIFLYSAIKGFDLMWHIEQKMKYNNLRPYKHGKEY